MELLKRLPSKVNDEFMCMFETDIETYQRFTQYIQTDIYNHTPKQNTPTYNNAQHILPEINSLPLVKEENMKKCIKDCMNNKKSKKNPYDVIIELSTNIEINKHHIKDKLIEFISTKKFQSFFGVKKTAEVMKGLTEDKWNKSLILFLSFLFEVSFMYLNKKTEFCKEKTYTEHIIL